MRHASGDQPCHISPHGDLTRLSTFASKTPAVAGVLLIGLHYTAFRDAIREDSRQAAPLRGVTPRRKFAVEANVESRAKDALPAIASFSYVHFKAIIYVYITQYAIYRFIV